jgi:hypothetical protein
MPVGLTIALAEVFAVSFEALILYLLARKTLALSARQAALICFVASMSSFLAGLALASKIGKHRQACRNLTRRRPVCLQAVNLIYWLLTPCAS